MTVSLWEALYLLVTLVMVIRQVLLFVSLGAMIAKADRWSVNWRWWAHLWITVALMIGAFYIFGWIEVTW